MSITFTNSKTSLIQEALQRTCNVFCVLQGFLLYKKASIKCRRYVESNGKTRNTYFILVQKH